MREFWLNMRDRVTVQKHILKDGTQVSIALEGDGQYHVRAENSRMILPARTTPYIKVALMIFDRLVRELEHGKLRRYRIA